MKKYLFLLFLTLFSASPILAKNICYLPETPANAPQTIIKETKTDTLIVNGYLVIFFYYDVSDPILKDPYAEFNFKNITKLAELQWGKTNLDVDDYFDKNGETKPYVLIEIGGTVRDGWYKPMIGITRISTCYDYQKKVKDKDVVCYFYSNYYKEIVDSIENIFTPLVAIQSERRNKK